MTFNDFLGPGKGRLQLCKAETDEIIGMLEAYGFRGQRGSANRVEIYNDDLPGDWGWVGSFYWDKKRRCWKLYTPRPYIHTRKDLDIALSELIKDFTRIVEIEKVWSAYKLTKRSVPSWKRYLGAVVSFYERLFGAG